jgi:ribosomal protein S12 methylthiotransferase
MIEQLKNKKVGFISLGCDKNRVDLERIIFNLSNFGMTIVNNPTHANIIIVNTCSFLESARLESIENIVEMAELKNSSNLEKLIVTGCLNELNYADLQESMPEVDAFVNVKDNEKILEIIANLYGVTIKNNYINDRVLTTPNHYAYLKISEGCNNFCTYCLIPYIRGRYKSTPMEELVAEAKNLANRGVNELILVAQDVTKYGVDLYNSKKLVDLIRKISELEGIRWIRLLYCYPEEIDDNLIEEIKTNPKVLKYLDIPLQHVSTPVLKAMNRRSNYESICNLFDKLKSEIPDIVIRTTFILGFPGETENDVDIIEKFLIKYKLNNVGFFKYSREEGTNAYKLNNQIDEDIKQERLDRLSQIQYDIVQENNSNLLNKELEVIVDGFEGDYSICRYYGQCPDIDTIIYVNEKLPIGQFVKVKIDKILEYDLEGVKL